MSKFNNQFATQKLRQEMSVTGTGASFTPGTGEQMATNKAFKKKVKKEEKDVEPKLAAGKAKVYMKDKWGWEDAESIPNRPSKGGFIYKQLFEELDNFVKEMDANDPVLMAMRAKKDAPKPQSHKPNRVQDTINSTIKMLLKKRAEIERDMEQEAEPEGGPIADKYGDMLNKIDSTVAKLRGQGEWGPEKNVNMDKGEIERRAAMMKETSDKIHIGTDTKTDSNIYFEPATGAFSINVIDAAGNRWNKLQVNTIDDVVAKFSNWKWTEAGKAEFADELNETSGFKSGKEFINIKLQKYPKALAKVNNLISMIGENNFTMDMAEWIFDFFNNASFESPINEDTLLEGYNQFRNQTKTRSKPDQFHQAVREVRKKVQEINRLFEYVSRLKSELSEGEGGLKYKAHTEKALGKIKEMVAELNQNIKKFK